MKYLRFLRNLYFIQNVYAVNVNNREEAAGSVIHNAPTIPQCPL
jgi:hypothetical protein